MNANEKNKRNKKQNDQPSRLIDDGVSAKPLTLSRSAVFKNAGNCSCDTFTSPAYINSKIACKWEYDTSFNIIIGCFDGFSWKKIVEFDWVIIYWYKTVVWIVYSKITSNSDLK